MKKLIIAAALLTAFGANAAPKDYNYVYKLKCDKNTLPVLVMDNPVFSLIMIGSADKELLADHNTGAYRLVTSVELQGNTFATYAHSLMDGKGHAVKSVDAPVSSWDSFTLAYSGDGAARDFNLINDNGNNHCSIVSFSNNPVKK
ncbi:hypothetical protein [Citrobacter portucalensis]|uniref:hypothetical protein n=1 Tax=Citrobacter portucalensis TaxID=1639133 RepID=UPI003CEDA0BF